MVWKKATRALLDAIYPPVCLLCSEFSRGPHAHLCPRCGDSFEPVGPSCCTLCGEPFPVSRDPHQCLTCILSPPPFERCRGLYLYRGAMADALGCLKYGRKQALLDPLADALLRGVSRLDILTLPDVVVPVPASVKTLFTRGFNAAALLAEPVARHLGCVVVRNTLKRRGHTPQVGLSRSERSRNAAGSFVEGPGIGYVRGKKILLFDDVYTTGATIGACARLLAEEGASVSVLTLARRAPEDVKHLRMDVTVGSQDP